MFPPHQSILNSNSFWYVGLHFDFIPPHQSILNSNSFWYVGLHFDFICSKSSPQRSTTSLKQSNKMFFLSAVFPLSTVSCFTVELLTDLSSKARISSIIAMFLSWTTSLSTGARNLRAFYLGSVNATRSGKLSSTSFDVGLPFWSTRNLDCIPEMIFSFICLIAD